MNVIVLSAELEPARDFLIDVNDLLLAKIKGGKILPLYIPLTVSFHYLSSVIHCST